MERFGFARQNEVPGDDGSLMFASVEKGGVEVMYQTRASVVAESPGMATDWRVTLSCCSSRSTTSTPSNGRLPEPPVVKPRHKTFYGSTEIYVREPGGHTVGFAQMG